MPTRLIVAYAMMFVMAGGLAFALFVATREWRAWRIGRWRAGRDRRRKRAAEAAAR